jgi:hypothetical protein
MNAMIDNSSRIHAAFLIGDFTQPSATFIIFKPPDEQKSTPGSSEAIDLLVSGGGGLHALSGRD